MFVVFGGRCGAKRRGVEMEDEIKRLRLLVRAAQMDLFDCQDAEVAARLKWADADAEVDKANDALKKALALLVEASKKEKNVSNKRR